MRVGFRSSALLTAVVAAGCGTSGAEPAGFPATAERSYASGGALEIRDAGQLVATSDLVVRGRVTAVERGPTRTFDDGSGTETTSRLLVVEVTQHLFAKGDSGGETVRVSDGFWQDGDGYAMETLRWAEPGDEGWFFLSRDEDAGAPARYAVVSDSGRVLDGKDGPEYAPDTVWDDAAEAPLDLRELADLIARGVSDARSGVAQPARASVCRPSVPGDEDPGPICG